MPHPLYRPQLSGGEGAFEQSFDANVVHVDDDLVAFGELVPDPERPLPHGTPVHSLLFHLAEDGVELVELNDQGNTVPASAVAGVELASGHLRVAFRAGKGPFAGRVSLSPEIEIYEDADDDAVQLSAVRVRFTSDDARFARLRGKLGTLL